MAEQQEFIIFDHHDANVGIDAGEAEHTFAAGGAGPELTHVRLVNPVVTAADAFECTVERRLQVHEEFISTRGVAELFEINFRLLGEAGCDHVKIEIADLMVEKPARAPRDGFGCNEDRADIAALEQLGGDFLQLSDVIDRRVNDRSVTENASKIASLDNLIQNQDFGRRKI